MGRFKKILSLPWYKQLVIFSLVALLIYGAFRYFVTQSTWDEAENLRAQAEQLRRENALAQIASQRINEFRAAYARAEADYADLKALLPEQRELTNVLDGLLRNARGRLIVRRFTPKDDINQDFYSGKPIEVEVSGSYNNLGNFFADMATYHRIVSITDFRIMSAPEQASGRTIDAQFLLTAYYVSPERLQQAVSIQKQPNQTPPAAAGAR
ncbi:MAG: type 4a pilus biogenesis protein PilO [Pyrinomonas methylaliphatogenes]|nr:type 4a pilus biogenesis protein PilO [Pyrinomonas methylaliphatogenes]